MEDDKILRLPATLEATGLSRTRLYELIKRGEFPPPVKISVRAVGWRHSEIQEWIKTRALAAMASRTKRKAAEFLRSI